MLLLLLRISERRRSRGLWLLLSVLSLLLLLVQSLQMGLGLDLAELLIDILRLLVELLLRMLGVLVSSRRGARLRVLPKGRWRGVVCVVSHARPILLIEYVIDYKRH